MAILYLKDDNIKVNVAPGMNLRQVALKTGASMEFGCRVGDCGTCIAEVEKGMEYLSMVSEKEINVFEMLDQKSKTQRLMCQCMIDSQEGEIIISYNRS